MWIRSPLSLDKHVVMNLMLEKWHMHAAQASYGRRRLRTFHLIRAARVESRGSTVQKRTPLVRPPEKPSVSFLAVGHDD